MTNHVFATRDFCSGSTPLFNLVLKSGEDYCLYNEYQGFGLVRALRWADWGQCDCHLGPTDPDDTHNGSRGHFTGATFGPASRVLLKKSCFAFRSGSLRTAFPQAAIIDNSPVPQEQWKNRAVRAHTYVRRDHGIVGDDAGPDLTAVAALC